MMSFIKAVLFDMDGLIFDNEAIYKSAWQSASKNLGYIIDDTLWCSFIGVQNEECEDKLILKFSDSFPIIEFRKMWKEDYKKKTASGLEYKYGFRELINFLSKDGYILGLATSSSMDDVQKNFKNKIELKEFSLIISSDVIKNGKPNPETYLKASESLNISPNEIVVFEDSRNGMYAAINAGCKAVMVPDLLEPDEFIKENAFMILNSLDEAKDCIFTRKEMTYQT